MTKGSSDRDFVMAICGMLALAIFCLVFAIGFILALFIALASWNLQNFLTSILIVFLVAVSLAVIPLALCIGAKVVKFIRVAIAQPGDHEYDTDSLLDWLFPEDSATFSVLRFNVLGLAAKQGCFESASLARDIVSFIRRLRLSGQEEVAALVSEQLLPQEVCQSIFSEKATIGGSSFPRNHEVLNLVETLFRINEKEHNLELQSTEPNSGDDRSSAPRRTYPCSYAVPKEVWQQNAEERNRFLQKLRLFGSQLPTDQKIALWGFIATQYSSITMGRLYEDLAKEYRLLSLPYIQELLDLLPQCSSLNVQSKCIVLQEAIRSSVKTQNRELIIKSYDAMLQVIREKVGSKVLLACTLANYAYAKKSLGDRRSAKLLRRECNALCRTLEKRCIEQFKKPL